MSRSPRLAILLAALLAAPGAASAATIPVNTQADTVADDGACSLREAITAANADTSANGCAAGSGADVISVPGGVYTIGDGASDNTNVHGDFDITASVTIRGAGSGATSVSGAQRDRVFDVLGGTVRLESLTISGGRAPSGTFSQRGQDGGGIRNAGQLTVQDVSVTGNVAGRGGDGGLTTGGPNASVNGAPGGNGGSGGAIFTSGAGSSLAVVDSVIVGNSAGAGGNGGGATGGDGSTDYPGGMSHAGAGGAGGAGGGIAGTSPIEITRTGLTGNTAGAGGAGGSAYGGHGGNGSTDFSGSPGGRATGGAGGVGGAGGGVQAAAGLVVTASYVAQNAAGAGGAGGAARGGDGGAGGPDGSDTNTTGGVGGTSALTYGGDAGAGGDGGGLAGGAGATLTRTTVGDNHSGAGGVGGYAFSGGGGSGGTNAIGGAGSNAFGGAGGAGGRGAGVAVLSGAASLLNVTIDANHADPPGAGGLGIGGFGGAGPAGGGPGGQGTGGPGGAAGTGAALFGAADGHALVHATVADNATTAGGAGGQGNAGGGGGSGASAGADGAGFAGAAGPGGSGGIATPGGTLTNSILASNQGNCTTSLTDGGHDIVFGDATCVGANVDPLLGPLADNGGAVPTRGLSEGSPAIDAVPAAGAGCAATDARGVARPQAAGCDIGAFEVAPPGVATEPPTGTATGGAPMPDVTAPFLSGVSLTRTRFAVGPRPTAVAALLARRGTVFRFTLTEPASITIAIARARPGRRVGKRCVKPTRALRKAKRCTRFVAVGTLRRAGRPAGANRVAFSGRIGKRALVPGRYRATLRATDAAGNRSKPVRRSFRVVRR